MHTPTLPSWVRTHAIQLTIALVAAGALVAALATFASGGPTSDLELGSNKDLNGGSPYGQMSDSNIDWVRINVYWEEDRCKGSFANDNSAGKQFVDNADGSRTGYIDTQVDQAVAAGQKVMLTFVGWPTPYWAVEDKGASGQPADTKPEQGAAFKRHVHTQGGWRANDFLTASVFNRFDASPQAAGFCTPESKTTVPANTKNAQRHWNPSQPPANPQDFTDFVLHVVNRYKESGVHHFELFNEPNLDRYFYGHDANQLGSMLNNAYNQVKRADPDSVIIAGALSPNNRTESGNGDPRPDLFLDKLYASFEQPNGKPKTTYITGSKVPFDVVSMHSYNTSPVNVCDRATQNKNGFKKGQPSQPMQFCFIETINDVIKKHANGQPAKPIWITEMGIVGDANTTTSFQTLTPCPPKQTCEKNAIPVNSEQSQAFQWGYVLSQLKSKYPYVKTVMEYTWQDTVMKPGQAPLPQTSKNYWLQHLGLVRADGSAKPSLNVFTGFTDSVITTRTHIQPGAKVTLVPYRGKQGKNHHRLARNTTFTIRAASPNAKCFYNGKLYSAGAKTTDGNYPFKLMEKVKVGSDGRLHIDRCTPGSYKVIASSSNKDLVARDDTKTFMIKAGERRNRTSFTFIEK